MENTTSSQQPFYLPLSVTKSRGWNSSAARANGGPLNCLLLFSLPLIYSNSPTYTCLFLTLYHHLIYTPCSFPLFSMAGVPGPGSQSRLLVRKEVSRMQISGTGILFEEKTPWNDCRSLCLVQRLTGTPRDDSLPHNWDIFSPSFHFSFRVPTVSTFRLFHTSFSFLLFCSQLYFRALDAT